MKQYKKYHIIQIDGGAVLVDKQVEIIDKPFIHEFSDGYFLLEGMDILAKIISHTGIEKLKDSSLPLFEMPDNPMVLAREAAIMNNYDIKDDVFKHGFVLGYKAAGGYTEEDMRKAYYQGHKSGIGSDNPMTFEQVLKSLPNNQFSTQNLKKAQQAILCNIKDAMMDENYILDYLKSLNKYPTSALVLTESYYPNECDCYKADITDGCSNPQHCIILQRPKVDKNNYLIIKEFIYE